MACDAASRSRAGQFSLQGSSMRGSERELRIYEFNMQSPFADLILEYFDACTCFCRSLIFPPLFVCGSGRLLEKNAGVAAVWETHTLGVPPMSQHWPAAVADRLVVLSLRRAVCRPWVLAVTTSKRKIRRKLFYNTYTIEINI
jgi:hypothetical protein